VRVRIQTPSRIHITLIDLNGSYGRIDGGAGFALEEPGIVVEVETGSHEVLPSPDINPELVERAKFVLKKIENFFGFSARVKILRAYTPHCGLGSGTQLSLAIAKAYTQLHKINFSIRNLAEIVERGGTSGIGVAVFEMGGFIVDGGHSVKVKSGFSPSSASRAPPPPVIARHKFPWKVAVVVPQVSGFSGGREINLFEENCPIPLNEVREVSHIVLMKLMPAVVERDLDDFRKAVSLLQRTGFKKVEVSKYDFASEFLELFEGAGMSSTGTAFYMAVEGTEGKSLLKDMKRFFDERDMNCWSFISEPNNTGAEIIDLEN